MKFRDYFELNEFFVGSYKTQNTHDNVDTNKNYEDLDIDDVLMKCIKKIMKDNPDLHILHRDNYYSKLHHELSGVIPKQDDIHSLSTLPLKYFTYNSNDVTHKRTFKFEVGTYYNAKGKEALKKLTIKIHDLIERMFKSLGYYTSVKIKHDSEVMEINLTLSHHSNNIDFKDFMKHASKHKSA